MITEITKLINNLINSMNFRGTASEKFAIFFILTRLQLKCRLLNKNKIATFSTGRGKGKQGFRREGKAVRYEFR